MPLPPDDVRARLAQLRNEFAMRAALNSEYEKDMSGKYLHEMIPFEDWLAQRNAPQGKAGGGLIPNLDVMRLAIGGQGPRNWLKGSVEKVINPLKVEGGMHPDQLREQQKLIEDASALGTPGLDFAIRQMKDEIERAKKPNAINDWIERNLGNYIRKQMGHPNDPIRKLAEEGVLHTDPTRVEIIGGDNDMGTHANRRREMFGGQKMAKGPLAQAWEDAVDTRFEGYKIKDLQSMPEMHEGHYEPWMDKADPNTLIFEPYAFDELGFDHIVDILKEDLAQGRIRPEQLSKVSMEQAVRRVHQYDQERKKAMAETALKATEGMPVHKDYGDGFKWIELTLPKDLPEGWTAKPLPSGGETYYDPQGVRHVHPNMGKLKDALKYEGDTMGHCVGGYCPDVAEGRSRIFSLRDAKNEPHVTVEVKPHHILTWDDVSMAVGPNKASELWNEFNDAGGYEKNADEAFDAFVRKKGIKGAEKIAQIKGKGNAKPKKDYIPYVQDFVRSGNWSEVNDFRNTDLIRKSDLIDKFSPEELDAVGKGEYLTPGEHSDLLLKALQPPKGKAHGGEVDAEEVFMGKGGLAGFLKDSAVKDRVYHGSGADITEFKPSKFGALGPGVYVSKNPREASEYASAGRHKHSNVLPLHIQVKNPFLISHTNNSNKELFKHFDPEGKLNDEQVIDLVKKAGYDAIHATENGEINVLDPRKIKSAIGNRGTYDTTKSDITKSQGGEVDAESVFFPKSKE